jgi:hypothetical protein
MSQSYNTHEELVRTYRSEGKGIGEIFTDGEMIIKCDIIGCCVRVWTRVNGFRRKISWQAFVITVIKLRVS